MKDLKSGQILWCKNGEIVIIKVITDDHIFVTYKGKTYKRPIGAITKTLFIHDPLEFAMNLKKKPFYIESDYQKGSNTSSLRNQKNATGRKKSEKTMNELMGRSWPTEGDATRFRKHNKKK